jgi:hypothetical protein
MNGSNQMRKKIAFSHTLVKKTISIKKNIGYRIKKIQIKIFKKLALFIMIVCI